MARWLAWLLLATVAACYNPPEPDCGFICGQGSACPQDYTCHTDNFCHRNGSPPGTGCDIGAAFNVLTALSTRHNQVVVSFSGPPSSEANDVANYSIPGLTIVSAMVAGTNTVTLTTSEQQTQPYSITVTNVKNALSQHG